MATMKKIPLMHTAEAAATCKQHHTYHFPTERFQQIRAQQSATRPWGKCLFDFSQFLKRTEDDIRPLKQLPCA